MSENETPIPPLRQVRAFIEATDPARIPVFDAYIVKAGRKIHPDDDAFMVIEAMGWMSFIMETGLAKLATLPQEVRDSMGGDDLKSRIEQTVADTVRSELAEKVRRVEGAESRVEQVVQEFEQNLSATVTSLAEASKQTIEGAAALVGILGKSHDIFERSETAMTILSNNADASRTQYTADRDKSVSAAGFRGGLFGAAIVLFGMGVWQLIAHFVIR